MEEGQEGERQKENSEIYVYGHIQFTSMCFPRVGITYIRHKRLSDADWGVKTQTLNLKES